MLMSVAFLLSALIQFALGLVAAWLLGPGAFGTYALALSAAVLLQAFTLEWLRLAATRFHHAGAGGGLSDRLLALFVRIAAGLVALSVVLAFFGGVHRVLFALVPLTALAAGYADLRAALLRAAFDQRGYAGLLLLRNALALGIMPAAAWHFATGEAVLAGFLLSLMLTNGVMLLAGRFRSPRVESAAEPVADVASLLRYALPIVATNGLYLAFFFGLRSGVALVAGMAAAGQFSLALDFGLKLFSTLGTALDLLLFQLAVREAREKGEASGRARLCANAAIALALLLPVALGLGLVIDLLEPFLVRPDFRGPFAASLVASMHWCNTRCIRFSSFSAARGSCSRQRCSRVSLEGLFSRQPGWRPSRF
jgi:O-antigen/teichoic acid export membrane protein